ncbi:phosphoribosyltransferase [Candidatus Roizmanbacteria bacterium CG_4_10_14_0_8_um_filter_39_9]|uniref:Phosphoribosyltransferase n=1 Tax=Candidatus Roizmanbacteria bacterium CG_4_10_14_0_8_um_filter_39_9 TaxID=1974829 RepID=A0A2M7QF43_9BACT|nr:MAG: phosphoribosyltransferase [Candidatus Roizmanbacteria bacterium CG_4_10_14_0_8_um_filter_39_9]
MEFLSLSWQQLHGLSFRLSKKIKDTPIKPDLIVAIARGGMSIAHMLSDFLLLPVATFTVSSYRDMKRNKLSNIDYHVGGSLKDKHILLVDDNADTGKTFLRGIEHLKEMGASSIQTASPLVKPWTKHLPDYYVQKTDKWIVFPYEVRETIEQIVVRYKKEKRTDDEIKKRLKILKISEKYIGEFFK